MEKSGLRSNNDYITELSWSCVSFNTLRLIFGDDLRITTMTVLMCCENSTLYWFCWGIWQRYKSESYPKQGTPVFPWPSLLSWPCSQSPMAQGVLHLVASSKQPLGVKIMKINIQVFISRTSGFLYLTFFAAYGNVIKFGQQVAQQKTSSRKKN